VTRFAMAMDTRKCVGCSACVLACKSENNTPEGFNRDWIVTETRGEFPNLTQEIRSERCHHCDAPPCDTACPTGATFVGFGGIVLVDAERCTGCKACIAACPYDARYVHPDGHVDKCTFCIHRVEKGLMPACVTVCPTRSLVFGDLDDPDSEISEVLKTREWKVQLEEAGTLPNLFFLT
jgi:Fe-S-cluster-containing dehydrogenase component